MSGFGIPSHQIDPVSFRKEWVTRQSFVLSFLIGILPLRIGVVVDNLQVVVQVGHSLCRASPCRVEWSLFVAYHVSVVVQQSLHHLWSPWGVLHAQCEAPSLARLVTCPGCTPCEHVDLVQQVASQELVELDLDEPVELVPGRSWNPKSHQPSSHLLQR